MVLKWLFSNRAFEDIVTEKSIQHVENLSSIAFDQFNRDGRGGFLVISGKILLSVKGEWV